VPLDELRRLLSATPLKVSRAAEALIAEHETAVTTVKVLPPAQDEISKDPIQAVVQITTERLADSRLRFPLFRERLLSDSS